METAIIQRSHIDAVFSMQDYVAAVEQAFRWYGEQAIEMPPKIYLSFPTGDLRCMPVYVPPMGVAGVKNVTVFPGKTGLPSVMGTITLIDAASGYPIAMMDGARITAMRTGAAGGVAAKYLARQDARSVALIGAGAQAMTQLEALRVVRPDIARVVVYDIHQDRARAFVEAIDSNLDCTVATSVAQAVAEVDIITTCTPVRTPLVMANDIPSGVHINAIGADAAGKQELDPEILAHARVVIDDWEQASHSGEINVSVSNGTLTQDQLYGDIGEIITGRKPGRESADQVTVFDSTGLAVQDIVVAKTIYDKITQDASLQASVLQVKFE